MITRLVTAPLAEPVVLADVKSHVRIDSDVDDPLIERYIRTSRIECEQIARRAFMPQTWDLVLDCWPCEDVIELPYPPLQSVTSITYIDSIGVTHTVANSNYIVDVDAEPGRVFLAYGKCWPTATLQPRSAIRVRYVAGYADAASVPETYKTYVMWGVGQLYENRGDADFSLSGRLVSALMMDRGSW